jgi:uncharacterized protein
MVVPRETRSSHGLIIFLVLVFSCSAWLALDNAQLSGTLGRHLISLYMWSVACASLGARLWMREAPRDVSFRWTGRPTVHAMLIATALPVAVELIVLALGWGSGLVHFAPAPLPPEVFGIPLAGSFAVRFSKYIFINLTLGSLWSCKSAAGEEIGWRGYMLTRLREAGIPAPICISGLIWGVWHLPLILGGEYSSIPKSIFSISIFVVDLTGLAYILAWLRLSSQSIWPCIWAHGIWNAVFMGSSYWSVQSGDIWVGESGLLTAFAVIAIAVALYRVYPVRPYSPDQLEKRATQKASLA